MLFILLLGWQQTWEKKIFSKVTAYNEWKKNYQKFCHNLIDFSNYSSFSEVLSEIISLFSFIHHESDLSLGFSAPLGINIPFSPDVTTLTLLFRLCTLLSLLFARSPCAHFLPSAAAPFQHPRWPWASQDLSCGQLVKAGNTEMKGKVILNS